ncbi:hypothetical protein CHRY9390_03197 [Chryseobacterium aquaeductus]|uniref:Uncharacterized protein n=1 Tax=Chryseobacterium aquaeductus TaxID=2675056 RepID=A0A9N8QTW5_9FLAO|nr:hypothetical protein CHRY9390_03197 [Chryseobacterium potabilaquae]CAD7816577.1 hypothetical protein CHRY9390_03197 [Chryseobacterium aquaeductus]
MILLIFYEFLRAEIVYFQTYLLLPLIENLIVFGIHDNEI